MEIKTTIQICDYYDSEFLSQNKRLELTNIKWVRVDEINKMLNKLEKYSHIMDERGQLETVVCLKDIIKELKQ